MGKLNELEPLVERTLEMSESSRGDNFILYLNVLQHYIDTDVSFSFLCKHHKELGIPSLESITRARRKVQERRPELRDEDAVRVRKAEEKKHRDYALDIGDDDDYPFELF